MRNLKATIRNVGPLGSFELVLPGPGLHLLKGEPESGKSTIERALTLAALDKPSKKDADRARLEVSWDAEAAPGRGLPEGQVLLPGLSGGVAGISLRADGRVTRLPDPPAVKVISGEPFALLTRHGYVGGKERDAAELKAFAAITGLATGPAALVPAEHVEAFADLAEGPLHEVAEEVRKRAHALKGRALDEVAARARRVDLLKACADAEAAACQVGLAEAQSALDMAEERAAQLRIDRRGRIRAEAEREQHRALHPVERPDVAAASQAAAAAREALTDAIGEAAEGLPPEPPLEDLRDRALLAGTAANQAAAELQRIRVEIAELQRQESAALATEQHKRATAVAAAKAVQAAELEHQAWQARATAHAERVAKVQAARLAAEQAERQAQQAEASARAWDAVEALLSAPVEGPEQVEADAATEAARQASQALELAKRAQIETKRQADQEAEEQALAKEQARADAFEDMAKEGLRARIRQALEAAAITGWGIGDDGGLLCADPARAGALVPFSSLSGSTKDAAALSLILAHAGEAAAERFVVLLLPQEVADGMIEPQLKSLASIARARGVYLLGGKVAEGALRVETI